MTTRPVGVEDDTPLHRLLHRAMLRRTGTDSQLGDQGPCSEIALARVGFCAVPAFRNNL